MTHPLNELKRRLEDESLPLSKRFCLAKNVIHSHHFPTTPKERIIGEWLGELTSINKISNYNLKEILKWINNVDDFTVELKYKLIGVVSQYLHNNILKHEDIQDIAAFIENSKISAQLSIQIEDFLSISMTLLHNLSNEANSVQLVNKLLDNITKQYRDCKKKIDFLNKLIEEDNLETVFLFLNTDSRASVINLCSSILFPINKRPFYARYLNNMIRKDELDSLQVEKNDNMNSVIKVINAFLNPKRDQQFLSDFIKVFVCCFKSDSQLIFALYIIAVNFIDLSQDYIKTVTKLTPIAFEGNSTKIKRNIFLNMLDILLENEADISVHLRDTLNEKSKETKKTFILFLQDLLTGTVKVEGKLDKTSFHIIKSALKLDPSLVEPIMKEILPSIMISRKSTSTLEIYIEMLNILLHTLFKLSKGINLIHILIPALKSSLESADLNKVDVKNIFPDTCLELYGMLTSELMFRQNKELLVLLQNDLDECLTSLQEEHDNVSLVTLAELLANVISSFLSHNKMADHSVPLPISEDFWPAYQNFENTLKKFGEILLNLDDRPTLIQAFLNLCLRFLQMKILNLKYSNIKLQCNENLHTEEVTDLSSVLPCLNAKQWREITSKISDENGVLILNNLILAKIIVMDLSMTSQTDEITQTIYNTKDHLIKHLINAKAMISSYYAGTLFSKADKKQLKLIAKNLLKMHESDPDLLQNACVASNSELLSALLTEVLKNITKNLDNVGPLTKYVGKGEFEIEQFVKDIDLMQYFDTIAVNSENDDDIIKYLDVMRVLKIYYLNESSQLKAIFVLLLLKKCSSVKKIKRSIDFILQSIFEVSPKRPDVLKLLSVPFLFNFENGILKLLKMTARSTNHTLIIREILESATRKVRNDPSFIRAIVDLLLDNYKKIELGSMDHFCSDVFQIICIIVPLIAKEKKSISPALYKSNLADIYESLNAALLESFKSIDFGSILPSSANSMNADESIITDNSMSILNAMGTYALVLSKCCESNDEAGIKSLWSGLEFFIHNAIHFIENSETKALHVDTSIHLINVVLRHFKKLESHDLFKNKDEVLLKIWKTVEKRLFIIFDQNQKKKSISCLENIGVTIKFLSQLASMEIFVNNFVADLNSLSILKAPSVLLKTEETISAQVTKHNVLKCLCQNILSSYVPEAKCSNFKKFVFRVITSLRSWIQQHYCSGEGIKNGDHGSCVVKIEDPICTLIKIDLEILAELILEAKKISLDYKFMDAVFELQQLIHYLLGRNTVHARCETTWQSFFILFEGSVAILNSLILAREELLEDRWPCLMQCYKTLVLCLCERSVYHNEDVEIAIEYKLAEIAHSIEKLTQSISKKKNHVSRIAAYAVADFCFWLEKSPPPKAIRQHIENSIVLLIQASDSNHAMAFLRRCLAGSIGQTTLTNMYTMYKRYHKYVGNA
ncbi:unnamed protein product [Leptosia nina]|uniref:Nucleolar 27S pre-rRNA processing Urb2/Npa2 C-terminal domain-containing protein n=1 Tax=Leptosia nina TaxID=320188 RepID=A0AAV1JJ89_9NEOP